MAVAPGYAAGLEWACSPGHELADQSMPVARATHSAGIGVTNSHMLTALARLVISQLSGAN